MNTENNNAGTNPDVSPAKQVSPAEHISLDRLVDAYYEACDDAGAVRAHLATCESCSERWNDLARKRSAAAQPIEVSAEFLAAQRRRIYERIEQPAPKRWRVWVPTAATAALLTAAIFVFRPVPETPRPEVQLSSKAALRPEINDAQLFSEVYSLDQTYEPSAAAPIQALFVEDQN